MTMACDVHTVGVIGAGTMGAGIAQTFAQHGFRVRLCDSAPLALERALGSIDRSLSKLVEKGSIAGDVAARARTLVSTAGSLESVADCDLVVEAIVEHLAAKTAVFGQLGALTRPTAILASNTSSISITRLASDVAHPDRVVGMHFMNPVPLMPLVEIIRGRDTSNKTVETVQHVTRALGKTGVEANDAPGFIANRVLMPMINEAAYALRDGVGTAEAIDTVMKLGMNHPMGPLALADLIGLDVCVAILDVLREGLQSDKYAPCPLLRDLVSAGHLGRKTGRGFFEYPAKPK
jgi:3-hydroxybutyryl-CoA dehydrogenase